MKINRNSGNTPNTGHGGGLARGSSTLGGENASIRRDNHSQNNRGGGRGAGIPNTMPAAVGRPSQPGMQPNQAMPPTRNSSAQPLYHQPRDVFNQQQAHVYAPPPANGVAMITPPPGAGYQTAPVSFGMSAPATGNAGRQNDLPIPGDPFDFTQSEYRGYGAPTGNVQPLYQNRYGEQAHGDALQYMERNGMHDDNLSDEMRRAMIAPEPKVSRRQRRRQNKPTAAQRAQMDANAGRKSSVSTRVGLSVSTAGAYMRQGRFLDLLLLIGDWIYRHRIPFLCLCAIVFLLIGFFFNRYVSWGGGLALVLIGILVGRTSEDREGFPFILTGFLIYLIPFLV